VRVDQLFPLLPAVLHEKILDSQYYADNTASLLFKSDESRSAKANLDDCYEKLLELVVKAYDKSVPGETSIEQKEKVKKLQKMENEARLRRKKLQSSKKNARSKSNSD
jgi:peptidyl-tRNA hydrolase ICT1